jgi:AP-2 complex subunit alpha
MLPESSNLMDQMLSFIRMDLMSNNEIFNSLALHAIATVGSQAMAQEFSQHVCRMLVGNSRPFVKKKAALCLLRLYRKFPDFIPAADWAPQIMPILNETDLGVLTCATSLVSALAQNFRREYAACSTVMIERIYKIVVEKEYSVDYAYYKIPVPWLQVKILRLLQYCPPTEDRRILQKLQNVLHTIIHSGQEITNNVQQTNAQNAVLFEAISLAIHLDPYSVLVTESASLLGKFLTNKQTNIRYLALESMAHLASVVNDTESLKMYQGIVIQSLRDRDISVRRRALDVLYTLCDVDNAKVVVAELLRILANADYNLREEMVLKIAILTEKYATEYSWYVDTILQLINTAGNYVGEEVWYRVVQIVTNNEDLREYATKTILANLQQNTFEETTVKVGGYLLGEYGDRIVQLPNCTPIDQFTALHSKFPICTIPTRNLLLTTYLKLVNLFPEIKPQVASVFKQYSHILDTELQQRACEYLEIVSQPNEDIILTVCEEMPPFPERESALLNRLHKKNAETQDQAVWSIFDKDLKDSPRQSTKESDLLGLEATTPNGKSSTDGLAVPGSAAGANTEKYFEKSLFTSEGLLFEDAHLQIGFKSKYTCNKGKFVLYVGNKLDVDITGMQINFSQEIQGLKVEKMQEIAKVIPSKAQLQHYIQVECVKAYTQIPMIRITYVTTGAHSLLVKLPIMITKFIEPVTMSSQDFFQRWKQLGDVEAQSVFRSGSNIDLEKVRKVVSGFQLQILENLDPNPDNIVSAGIFNMSQGVKDGILVRVEPIKDKQIYRVTVKSTNSTASQSVHDVLAKVFSGKAL